MTSAEIRELIHAASETEERKPEGSWFWLREVALQLAVKNEREERADIDGVNRMLRKVGMEGLEIGLGKPEPQEWIMNTTHVMAIDKPFPFVHHDGYRGGRQWWGVWYGPGPAARSFPAREAAEKYLKENPPMAVPAQPLATSQSAPYPARPQAKRAAKKTERLFRY